MIEQRQLLTIADEIVGSVRRFVSKTFDPLEKRVKEIEDTNQSYRAHITNKLGVMAEAIAAIPAGKNGKDGKDGINGKDGQPGVDGKDGQPGERGAQGEPGVPGVSVKGEKGATGEKGEKGDPGDPLQFESAMTKLAESIVSKLSG